MRARFFEMKTIAANLAGGVAAGFFAAQSDHIAREEKLSPRVSNSVVELLNCMVAFGAYITAEEEHKLNTVFAAEIGFWLGWAIGRNTQPMFSPVPAGPKP